MSLSKYCFAFSLFLVSFSAFSQIRDSIVFLKWKLTPNEVLSYKTVMKEIDTSNHKDFSMEGMRKLIGIKGDKKSDEDLKKTIKQLNAEIENADFITNLTETSKGIINIALSAKVNEIKQQENDKSIKGKKDDKARLVQMQSMIAKMNNGVMLRGAIYEDGTIESFYTKNDQRNLLAIMFELPGKAVKPGDTWPLSIHLLSMDQNFVCDSSYRKNQVTYVGLENRGGEHIATLKYDIIEYVIGDFKSPLNAGENIKTSMKMTYQGISEFSLEKGRWVAFDGIMSLSATGIMSSQTTKKISLIAQ